MSQLPKLLDSFETSKEFRIWALNDLIQITEERIEVFRKQIDKPNWRKGIVGGILSPSDVGIHNTIRNEKGLRYIDFEYSGIDDLRKLIADWVLQPEAPMNEKQESQLINQINYHVGKKSKGHTARYMDIKPLIHVKWCYIIIKQQLKQSMQTKHDLENKAMSYASLQIHNR